MNIMKCFLCISIIILILDISLFAQYSQNIDPRQYVTLQYSKYSNYGKLDTIWNWEKNPIIPYQKFQSLDIGGNIQINFNIPDLIANNSFEGTISLEAEISGKSGTRKIEVNPYSEVGIERKPIGIKSEAPSEVAKKLVHMLIEINEVEGIFEELNSNYKERIDSATYKLILEEIQLFEDKFSEKYNLFSDDSENFDSLWRGLIGNLRNLYDFSINGNYSFWANMSGNFPNRKKELLIEIRRLMKDRNSKYLISVNKALEFSQLKSDIVLSYLNAIEKAGPDALKGFFALINKDKIGFENLKKGLNQRIERINNIKFDRTISDEVKAMVLLENEQDIIESTKYLNDLSNLKGTFIEKAMIYIKSTDPESLDFGQFDDLYSRGLVPVEETKFHSNSQLMEIYFNEIVTFLAIKAGQEIYKKFVYGAIDLGKSGAKEDEVLNIYINWIFDENKENISTAPRLPIGKYFLKESGVKLEITDMFALVKRIDESKAMSQNISPTNFKGSGGVVLNWTYYKTDKGIEIKNSKITRRNKFLNFFEPSFGLNISYLDFSIEKDVEIGIGSQLGLFRNKIYLGYGTNIHMYSPIKESPNYFYIGFSFANLTTLFKGK